MVSAAAHLGLERMDCFGFQQLLAGSLMPLLGTRPTSGLLSGFFLKRRIAGGRLAGIGRVAVDAHFQLLDPFYRGIQGLLQFLNLPKERGKIEANGRWRCSQSFL